MKQHIAGLCLVVLSGVVSVLAFQSRSVRPVSVCDVIPNLDAYKGQTVAVVGRLSGTDEGTCLAEENCPQVLQMNGFTWPAALWITADTAAPKRKEGQKLIDQEVLKRKVLDVSSRTPLFPRSGYAVLYGRLEAREKLEVFKYPDGHKTGVGFGHLGIAPAQLVIGDDVIQSLFEKEIRAIVKQRSKR